MTQPGNSVADFRNVLLAQGGTVHLQLFHLVLLLVRHGADRIARSQPLQFLLRRAQLSIDRHALIELLFPRETVLDPLHLPVLARIASIRATRAWMSSPAAADAGIIAVRMAS